MEPQLFLLMGLPGAGKTTVAYILEELTGATRLTSDEERVKLWPKPTFTEEEHQALYNHLNDLTARLLSEGKSVIYDANLNRKAHRQEKYELANKFGVECVLILVKADHTIAKQRRIDENIIHLVPRDETPAQMFERIAHLIELPDTDEEPIILDGTKITKEHVIKQLQLYESNRQ